VSINKLVSEEFLGPGFKTFYVSNLNFVRRNGQALDLPRLLSKWVTVRNTKVDGKSK